MDILYTELKKYGKVKLDEPLSKHTSYKLGGPARYFVVVEQTDKFVSLLQFLDGEGEKYIIFGGGSNMLVRDEGYDGVIIQVHSSEFTVQNNVMIVDSGCTTVRVAQESIRAGLTGFEWGVGVPGTIGGAIRGNAGIPTGEMKDSVQKVEVYRDGEIFTLDNTECTFSYRDSVFKHNHDIILRAWLRLEHGENKDLQKKALEYISYRNKTQPKGLSSGCIFKNFQFTNFQFSHDVMIPEEFLRNKKIPAGWLIEHAGLKGRKVGGAQVSDVHGNFIINNGKATAQDVLTLIDDIKQTVYTTYGIELEEEIQII